MKQREHIYISCLRVLSKHTLAQLWQAPPRAIECLIWLGSSVCGIHLFTLCPGDRSDPVVVYIRDDNVETKIPSTMCRLCRANRDKQQRQTTTRFGCLYGPRAYHGGEDNHAPPHALITGVIRMLM